MFKGFKDFLLRGNVVDLAVAVIIGAAFGAVVTAFTTKVIQPFINALGGASAGNGLGFSVRSGSADVEKATFVDLGALITATLNFVIVAAVVYFLVVVPVTKLMEMRKRGEVQEAQATPEDVALLQEIRDLLRARGGAV